MMEEKKEKVTFKQTLKILKQSWPYARKAKKHLFLSRPVNETTKSPTFIGIYIFSLKR